MAVERPADTEQKPSYIFSEQIDRDTGIPVGMVPLESVCRQNPELFEIKLGSRIHDVGVGRGGSTDFILSKVKPEVLPTLNVVTSDPYPEEESPLNRLASIVKSHTFIRDFANGAVARVKDCDLISMVNMIHLIPEKQREEVPGLVWKSLSSRGKWIISTVFIEEWFPNEEVKKFIDDWTMAKVKEVAKRGIFSVREFVTKLKEHALKTWEAKRYIEEVKKAGFQILFPPDPENIELQTMPGIPESYRLISHDKQWSDHSMPGIDYEMAAEISCKTLDATLQRKGWADDHLLPRNTLVVIAQKPA